MENNSHFRLKSRSQDKEAKSANLSVLWLALLSLLGPLAGIGAIFGVVGGLFWLRIDHQKQTEIYENSYIDTYEKKENILNIKMDDDGELHIVTDHRTYTDYNEASITYKDVDKPCLIAYYKIYEDNKQVYWHTTISLPMNYKMEIFND